MSHDLVTAYGFEVLRLPEPAVVSVAPDVLAAEDPEADVALLDFVVRRGVEEIVRFSAEADPDEPRVLRDLLLMAVPAARP